MPIRALSNCVIQKFLHQTLLVEVKRTERYVHKIVTT